MWVTKGVLLCILLITARDAKQFFFHKCRLIQNKKIYHKVGNLTEKSHTYIISYKS